MTIFFKSGIVDSAFSIFYKGRVNIWNLLEFTGSKMHGEIQYI